ncbi:hypothetical protein GUJ93_ZPchr0002g24315 [Zizania palustris]|uniref:Uncharacterized protein n=1 Tax=Zizania palustris TaxID=103762 RepID=A0A8J5SJC7_ZIZPA|nr:hypothetical protein GUJ93_ZPchr0002g24315 [Zizania palustris]
MVAPVKGKGEDVVVGQDDEDEERCLEMGSLIREMERFNIHERWEGAAEALRREDAATIEAVGCHSLSTFDGLEMSSRIWSDAMVGSTSSLPGMARDASLPILVVQTCHHSGCPNATT